jgi:hypothetical protein
MINILKMKCGLNNYLMNGRFAKPQQERDGNPNTLPDPAI